MYGFWVEPLLAIEAGEFKQEEGISRVIGAQSFEYALGFLRFFLTDPCHGQQDTSIRAKECAALRRFLQVSETPLSIAPCPDEKEEKALYSREATQNIVVRAKNNPCVVEIRMQLVKFLMVLVGFFP